MRTLRTLHVATAAVSESSKAISTRKDISIDRKILYIYIYIYTNIMESLTDYMTCKGQFSSTQ